MNPIIVLCNKEGFQGGPKAFRERFRPALKKHPDIQVTNKPKGAFHVELVFIRKKNTHKKPHIIRLDGCYYRKKEIPHNDRILKSTRRANHIIFQSKFSETMCRKIMGLKPKASTVIYNGIDLNWVDSIEPYRKIVPGSFVACSSWKRRPNKRPLSIIRGFIRADTGRHLYMIGKYHSEWKAKYKKYNVHFLDEKKGKDVISIMKACDYQMHLCHIDSCPNAVVEGLASGLNVLCTNLGGTRELVRDNGVVLDIDEMTWSPSKLGNSTDWDNLNPDTVAEGIWKLMKMKDRVSRLDLDMKLVVDKYVRVIKKVVNG